MFILQTINLNELLLRIHNFFDSLGGEEIRRRGAREDKPLRMVKTILHEVSATCVVNGQSGDMQVSALICIVPLLTCGSAICTVTFSVKVLQHINNCNVC